jgi:hypothetical protein
VASGPQCDSLDRVVVTPALPVRVAARSFCALDAPPARETLMLSIMSNAIALAGCTPDLELFEQ